MCKTCAVEFLRQMDTDRIMKPDVPVELPPLPSLLPVHKETTQRFNPNQFQRIDMSAYWRGEYRKRLTSRIILILAILSIIVTLAIWASRG